MGRGTTHSVASSATSTPRDALPAVGKRDCLCVRFPKTPIDPHALARDCPNACAHKCSAMRGPWAYA